MKSLITLIVIFSSGILLVASDHFGYSLKEQRKWHKHFPECGRKGQSPIEIHPNKAVPKIIAPLKLVGYDEILSTPLRLHNNGHSIDSTIYHSKYKNITMPRISGGNLNGLYEFDGFHFHWGKANNEGSEHVIDGSKHTLEMHVVHRNVKYATNEIAQKKRDGFVVFAVLYHLSKVDGKEVDPIADSIRFVQKYDTSTLIKSKLSLRSFLGRINVDNYYTYEGSFTTPPCSEAITWIIFRDTLAVSGHQLNRFRNVLESDGKTRIVQNHRETQPLNNRKVYIRQAETSTYY